MTYDLEEQEQIDALKAWWAKYGNLLLSALTVVMLAVAGWQGWNWYQRDQAGQAAGYFEALQAAAAAGNLNQVADASGTLRSKFSKTDYAPRAALVAAQAYVMSGDAERARVELVWLVDNRKDAALAPIARLRLAGVLMDLGQYDAALNYLASAAAGYESLYADRRGDVLHAQGQAEQARAAWREALDAFEADSPLRSVVQLKLNALGDNV